jgi:hypothetical protein
VLEVIRHLNIKSFLKYKYYEDAYKTPIIYLQA